MSRFNHIGNFIKFNRKKLKLTQFELSEKAGVGLRFIRDIEQGKESLRLDKVNQVLALFGYKLWPSKGIDPYEILLNHLNKNVKIHLKNKSYMVGVIIKERWKNNEIESWDFVKNINAIEYQKTEKKELLTNILHNLIEKIENL